MTLTVDIYREYDHESSRSRLRAVVVQELLTKDGEPREVRGTDLLVRRFTHVDSAIRKCNEVLTATYKLVAAPTIRYRVSEDAAPAAKPKAAKLSAPAVAIPPAAEPDPFAEIC